MSRIGRRSAELASEYSTPAGRIDQHPGLNPTFPDYDRPVGADRMECPNRGFHAVQPAGQDLTEGGVVEGGQGIVGSKPDPPSRRVDRHLWMNLFHGVEGVETL